MFFLLRKLIDSSFVDRDDLAENSLIAEWLFFTKMLLPVSENVSVTRFFCFCFHSATPVFGPSPLFLVTFDSH